MLHAIPGWLIPKLVEKHLNLYFIVSTGRTGTKFFARLFRHIDSIRGYHEPDPTFLEEALAYAQGRVSDSGVAQLISRNRRVLFLEAHLKGCSAYVESNNRLFSLIGPLKKRFPHAGIIHIVRDGRDYVRSGMSRNWYTETDRGPRLRADMFPDDPLSTRWDEMTRFEKVTWLWQKKDGVISDAVDGVDNTVTVKFGDIFCNPDKSGLFEITRFIGLSDQQVHNALQEMGSWKPNKTTAHTIPKWTEWSDAMLADFDRIAGHHMRRHGYGQ